MDRNLLLYQACLAFEAGGEGLTEGDEALLSQHGLKSSVLEGKPLWLKKWAALICEFVEFEQTKFGETEEGRALTPQQLQDELKNLKVAKLADIAITIDKVSHVLVTLGTDEPPLRTLSH